MYKVLVLGGSPSGTNTITLSDNTQDKFYFVVNASGDLAITPSGGDITTDGNHNFNEYLY